LWHSIKQEGKNHHFRSVLSDGQPEKSKKLAGSKRLFSIKLYCLVAKRQDIVVSITQCIFIRISKGHDQVITCLHLAEKQQLTQENSTKYKYHVHGKATKQRSRNQDGTQKKIQKGLIVVQFQRT